MNMKNFERKDGFRLLQSKTNTRNQKKQTKAINYIYACPKFLMYDYRVPFIPIRQNKNWQFASYSAVFVRQSLPKYCQFWSRVYNWHFLSWITTKENLLTSITILLPFGYIFWIVQSINQQWDALVQLANSRKQQLEGAHDVQRFMR